MKKCCIVLLALCLLLTGCGAPAATEPPTAPVETAAPTQAPTEAPAEASTEAPTEPPYQEVSRATIIAGGDLLPHMGIIKASKYGDEYRFDQYFTYVTDAISQADFAVANLETTLAGTEDGQKYAGYPCFNAPDTLADAAKGAGFDMLLTSNNHANDTRSYGISRTLKVLREKEILSLGSVETEGDPLYRVVEINGIKIGMVCYSFGEIKEKTGNKYLNGLKVEDEHRELINVFDSRRLDLLYAEIEQHIADMKAEGAEATVLYIHWGHEYHTKQSETQTEMAQKLCEMGIDVIIGGHPHVVQGVELLESETGHRTLCAYSVGNLLSNQRRHLMELQTGHTEDGLLVRFTFVKYSDGSVHLEFAETLPTWVCLRQIDEHRVFHILPLDGDPEDWAERFGLSSSELKHAKKSLERTNKITAQGMADAVAELEQLRLDRLEEHQ